MLEPGKIQYCKCGSIIENGKCTWLKCPFSPAKYCMWVINGRFLEFQKPVTLSKAKAVAKTKGLHS